MEQPQTPPEPPPPPEPAPPAPKAELPDTRGALPIPDQFRFPFHGKMATPTAVPSATERRFNLSLLEKRRRRRGFLLGLLSGQVLILGMDFGGAWLLRTHPQVKLQAPFGVPSVVFLGMALGSAAMLLGLALMFGGLGLRALFGKPRGGIGAAIGRGLRRVVQTSLVLGVSMAVILGTAWFMIPAPEWKPTVDFAKDRGRLVAEGSKSSLKSMFRSGGSSR